MYTDLDKLKERYALEMCRRDELLAMMKDALQYIEANSNDSDSREVAGRAWRGKL